MKHRKATFRNLGLALVVLALPQLVHADTDWVLESSTLSYHVSHPLHQVDGVSHAAKGKGVCQNGQCNFLIAAPVKSFDSGDSNRDLHMLQVTRGAEFPMIVVRTQFAESEIASGTVHADLQVEFAGQTAQYKQIAFQLVTQGSAIKLSGTIPATLTDFKIPAPSLLAMAIKNDIPVRVEMSWTRSQPK
ncbi:MAG TPA: YceI family protein [Candidatus Acidoferrales bacterium]|nr:YceI family protein [Candidatus Acidoferrales bacterium]